MNKTKKILTAIMAVILVGCMGYFSVLTPTTAWFYQGVAPDNLNKKFTFASLDFTNNFSVDYSGAFEAATMLGDETELMFDDMVKTIGVEMKNTGDIEARVYIDVTDENSNPGLHWFYCEAGSQTGARASITHALGDDLSMEALDKYNLGDTLDEDDSGFYITVPANSTRKAKIFLWIEYDEVASSLNSSSLNLLNYVVNVSMTSSENKDAVFIRRSGA